VTGRGLGKDDDSLALCLNPPFADALIFLPGDDVARRVSMKWTACSSNLYHHNMEELQPEIASSFAFCLSREGENRIRLYKPVV